MKRFVLALLVVPLIGAAVTAQPQHGDLVLSLTDGNWQIGYTVYASPSNLASLTTLAVAAPTRSHDWVAMAPDNTDLVITDTQSTSHLLRVTPYGAQSTIATRPSWLMGFDLDHDDTWVAVGCDPQTNRVLGIQHQTGVVTTYHASAIPRWPNDGIINSVAIDRDPGGPTYAVAYWYINTFTGTALQVLGVDRNGNATTMVAGSGGPLMEISSIALHARSGDYLTTDFIGPWNGGGVEVNRLTKTGAVTTLVALRGANAARITQSDTAWIVGRQNAWPNARLVMHYDLSTRAVLGINAISVPNMFLTGVEVYGSRTLVCNQSPSTPRTVTVRLKSHHQSIQGGEQYVLAASFARRPGIKFSNGEWLDLNVTSPLFFLSALNLAPGVFQNFQGTVDPFGNATATVSIPTGLPALNDMAIFVAGVIYSGANVIQVTNTHWFVLP